MDAPKNGFFVLYNFESRIEEPITGLVSSSQRGQTRGETRLTVRVGIARESIEGNVCPRRKVNNYVVPESLESLDKCSLDPWIVWLRLRLRD